MIFMPKICSIIEIRKKIQEYGKKINAPQDLLHLLTTPENFGAAHIEVDKIGYHFIRTERGEEIERQFTDNLNLLLYWFFKDVTFDMATAYELENRNPTEDFRRIYFAKNIELMEILDINYAKWLKAELDEILEKHPYRDP